MTEVIFRFHNPDGTPRIDTTFEVVFRRAGMVDDEDCVVVPETYTAVTDSEGVFTMSLEPASAPYRVTMIDPEADPDEDSCCGCSVSYQFYVPDSLEPVQAQDLFIAPPPRDVTWDEVAMEKLGQAVTDAEDSATEAAASAAAAEASSEGVEEYYLLAQEEAGKSAVSASESLSHAQDSLGSANAAAGSATAADTARAAAVVAKDAAEAAATDAETAVGNLEPRVDQLELDVDAAQLSANNAATAAATADGKAVTAQNTANAAKQVTDKLSALPTGINASYAYTIGADVNTHSWTALGTAAVANLTTAANDTTSGRAWRTNDLVKQTSASDTTAGRVLTNAAYGWGGAAPVLVGNDYNNSSEYSGLVRNDNAVAAVNYPPEFASPNQPFAALNARFSSAYGWQFGVRTTGVSPADATLDACLRAEVNGIWGNWAELWHSLNLKKQTSPSDATAGSVLLAGAGGLLGTAEDIGATSWNALGGLSRLVRGALNSSTDGPFTGAVWLMGVYVTLDSSGNNAVFHGSVVTSSGIRHFSRSKASGVWYAWVEMWHSGNFDPALKANLASPSFTGTVNIGNALQVNATAGGIEVGRTDGVAATGYIDFHSGATPTDYDVRIQCTGGNGTSGRGTLTAFAGNIDLYSSIGSTLLRHGGVQKLITSPTGITVSGQVESSLPTYNNLTLLAPYTWDAAADAADYNQPSYTKVDNVVRLRGKVTLSGTHVDNNTWTLRNIAVLPVGFRPAKRKAFVIFWDTDTPLYFSYCLVFVNTDGGILMLGANNQPYPFTEGHFPLDQIWFDLAP